MSGFTEEVFLPVASAVGSAIKFGAYAVYKAGELMVKGTAGLIKLTGKGAKALASTLAEQQRLNNEESERKRIEREKNREDARLEALGNQKKIAEERIRSIINDSNESAKKINQLIATARSEVQDVQSVYAEIAGAGTFDCGGARSRLEEISKRLAAVQTRMESDDTAAVLAETGKSIKNAGESGQVRDCVKSLHGNAELVAELQVEIASARMECEGLKKCALALKDLQKDLSELSVELTVANVAGLEKIRKIATETDAADYDSIMSAYRATDELVSQLKRTADAAKNVRLAAFLNSRLAVIQDRLNAIRGEVSEQSDNGVKSECYELLEQAEDAYAVLSDGRLDYMSGFFAEKMRTARISARAKNDVEGLRKTVKLLKTEAANYEELCAAHENYLAVKRECDELADALGYAAESDNFSPDKEELGREIKRLEELKKTYVKELAVRRRSTLIARSSLDFAREEYHFLGEFEFGDEDGTVQLLYARKGEAGAIHVVQADLNGYVYTYTTGVNLVKEGASLTTNGSAAVKKACGKMRENHVKNTREFNELIGVDYAVPVVSDISPDDPAAAEYPCITFDESVNGEILKEYLNAVNGFLYIENGVLKLVEKDAGAQGGEKVITGTGSARRAGNQSGAANGGVLAVDPNKK